MKKIVKICPKNSHFGDHFLNPHVEQMIGDIINIRIDTV